MEENLSIDRILDLWIADCGIEKTSDRGTTFLVVPIPDRRGHLLNLIQAMVKCGHPEEDIRSATVSTKVVKKCWSDLIVKMSTKDLKKSRDITRGQWEAALDEFFVKDFPRYVKRETPVFIAPSKAEEKPLELNPSDRIKLDTSGFEDAPLDLEFLAELGIDEASVAGKK